MKKFLAKNNLNQTTEVEGFEKSEFIDAFTGQPAEPIVTGTDGKISSTLLPDVSGVVDAAKEISAEFAYGESISALKLFYVGLDQRIYVATSQGTYDDARVSGITKFPGTENQVRATLVFGRIDDPFFTFPANSDLFLGENGNIVDTAPTIGHYKPIGRSLGPGSIFLNIGTTKVL